MKCLHEMLYMPVTDRALSSVGVQMPTYIFIHLLVLSCHAMDVGGDLTSLVLGLQLDELDEDVEGTHSRMRAAQKRLKVRARSSRLLVTDCDLHCHGWQEHCSKAHCSQCRS